MGLSNASELADYAAGIGTYGATLTVDAGNQRVGIGTTNPQATLQVGTGVTVYGNSGIVSATKFYGDGSNLSNTGSTLSAASGVQRVVVTSQTSGTMTASATDADITFNAGNNTLFVGTASSSFVAPRAIGIGTTNVAGRNAGVGTAVGTIIFVSDASIDGGNGQLEIYTQGGWRGISTEAASVDFEASGGTVTAAGITPGDGSRYHVFTAPGSLVVSGSKAATYLVVGGGAGGGGNDGGGGGGAGAVRSGPLTLTTGTWPITIGNGGSGSPAVGSSPKEGSPGNNTTLTFPTGPYVANGGGGGGAGNNAGNNDGQASPGNGSGGGGGWGGPNAAPTGPGGAGGTYGNPGGDGNGPQAAGGGGGAGGAGQKSPDPAPAGGAGGVGLAVPAFPAPAIAPEIPAPVRPTWTPAVGPTGLYGGGGGGGGDNGAGPGGPGGGGRGSGGGCTGSPTPSLPAVDFTGGGGGGGDGCTPQPAPAARNGTPGGSGIVIIKYSVS